MGDSIQHTPVRANKRSISMRRLVLGVGVNDANYQVVSSAGEGRATCHFYRTWQNMLERCYSDKFHELQPTYKNCFVAPEWLLFSTFKKWMESQDWENKELDKDVLAPGNNKYGPEVCVFVSREINNLITGRHPKKGSLPRGVITQKGTKKYRARIGVSGKTVHLGYFYTEKEAGKVYQEARRQVIIKAACVETDVRIKRGLYLHAELLK